MDAVKKVWNKAQQLTLHKRVELARERFMDSATRTFEVWERTNQGRQQRGKDKQ